MISSRNQDCHTALSLIMLKRPADKQHTITISTTISTISMPRMRGFSGLLPSTGNLQLLEYALHELAGILQAFCKYRLLRRNLSPK